MLNKHTWEYQLAEFRAWRNDYIVRYEPMAQKFIRAGFYGPSHNTLSFI